MKNNELQYKELIERRSFVTKISIFDYIEVHRIMGILNYIIFKNNWLFSVIIILVIYAIILYINKQKVIYSYEQGKIKLGYLRCRLRISKRKADEINHSLIEKNEEINKKIKNNIATLYKFKTNPKQNLIDCLRSLKSLLFLFDQSFGKNGEKNYRLDELAIIIRKEDKMKKRI